MVLPVAGRACKRPAGYGLLPGRDRQDSHQAAATSLLARAEARGARPEAAGPVNAHGG